jgi:hypothetical protein
MRRNVLGWTVCLLCFGCAGQSDFLVDRRPPTVPAPTDVQDEMRDARFFLPHPDQTIGPPTETLPQLRRPSLASQ